MFGEKKLFKLYTQSFLYLLISTGIIVDVYAKDPKEQIKSIVSSLENLSPNTETNCDQDKETKEQKSITSKVADTLFGFIAGVDETKPVQFYFYMRAGINTDGSRKYAPVMKRRSDVRVLDAFLRGETSDAKNLLSLSSLELEKFFDERTTLSASEREDARIILEMTKYTSESDILSTLKERTRAYDKAIEILRDPDNLDKLA